MSRRTRITQTGAPPKQNKQKTVTIAYSLKNRPLQQKTVTYDIVSKKQYFEDEVIKKFLYPENLMDPKNKQEEAEEDAGRIRVEQSFRGKMATFFSLSIMKNKEDFSAFESNFQSLMFYRKSQHPITEKVPFQKKLIRALDFRLCTILKQCQNDLVRVKEAERIFQLTGSPQTKTKTGLGSESDKDDSDVDTSKKTPKDPVTAIQLNKDETNKDDVLQSAKTNISAYRARLEGMDVKDLQAAYQDVTHGFYILLLGVFEAIMVAADDKTMKDVAHNLAKEFNKQDKGIRALLKIK